MGLRDYRLQLRAYQRDLAKDLRRGRAAPPLIAIKRLAIALMEEDLAKRPQRVVANDLIAKRPGSGPAEWARRWAELAARKVEPWHFDPAYDRKFAEYIDYGRKTLERYDRWRQDIIDRATGYHYVQRASPELKQLVAEILTLLRRWAELHRADEGYLRWSPAEGLQRMLEQRKDLVMALRYAHAFGYDTVKYALPVAQRPWHVEVASLAIGFVPIVGNVIAAYEAYSGRDIFGYALDPVERSILGATVLLPMVGRLTKGARSLYTTQRMVKLYGADARTWSRALAASERLSARPAALRKLMEGEAALRGRRRLTSRLAREIDDALRHVRPGAVGSPARPAVATGVREAFERLGRRHPILQDLDELAIQRVIERGPNVNHLKGQLLEELLESRVVRWLQDPAGPRALGLDVPFGELEFIPGHLIRDTLGDQITDGVLARAVGEELEIVAIFEAKAGEASSRGLKYASKKPTKLELAEMRAEARDHLRDLRERARRDGQPPPRTTLEELEKRVVFNEEGGQVRRDFERLDLDGDGRPTDIYIGSVRAPVRLSLTSTKFFAVLPRDVPVGNLVDYLTKRRYNVEILGIDIGAKDLADIASDLAPLVPGP